MPKKKQSGASTWVDPDDAPELTREYFEQADLYHGDTLIRRGRPPRARPKQAVKLRLSPDVLDHFRSLPRRRPRLADPHQRHAGTRGGKAAAEGVR